MNADLADTAERSLMEAADEFGLDPRKFTERDREMFALERIRATWNK